MKKIFSWTLIIVFTFIVYLNLFISILKGSDSYSTDYKIKSQRAAEIKEEVVSAEKSTLPRDTGK